MKNARTPQGGGFFLTHTVCQLINRQCMWMLVKYSFDNGILRTCWYIAVINDSFWSWFVCRIWHIANHFTVFKQLSHFSLGSVPHSTLTPWDFTSISTRLFSISMPVGTALFCPCVCSENFHCVNCCYSCVKPICFTNPFLHSLPGFVETAFTDFGLGQPDLLGTDVCSF